MGGITPTNKAYRYSKHRVSSVLRCGYCKAPFAYREKPVKRKGKKRVRIKQYTLPSHDKEKCLNCPKIIRNFDAETLEILFDHLYFLSFLNQEEVLKKCINDDPGIMDLYNADEFIEKHIEDRIHNYIKSKNSMKREMLLNQFDVQIKVDEDEKNILDISYYGIDQKVIVYVIKNTAGSRKTEFVITICSELYKNGRFIYNTEKDEVFYFQVSNKDLEIDLNDLNHYITNI